MPFIELPEIGLRTFYVINAPAAVDGEPASQPLDPSKPVLVLMHAALCAAFAFTSQLVDPRLKAAFNLVALDARFHGRTISEDRDNLSMEEHANDTLAALDCLLGPDTPFSIMAEGFLGGNAATWMAIKRPKQVRAMVLASPGPFEERQAICSAMLDEWLPCTSENKEGRGDGSGTIPPTGLAIASDYFFGRCGREPERRAAWDDWVQLRYGTGKSSMELGILVRFFLRKEIPAALRASIVAPVLILQGGDDDLTSPLSAAEAWRQGFRSSQGGADLRVINGAPHLLLYTDYNIANRFVLGFVSRYAK